MKKRLLTALFLIMLLSFMLASCEMPNKPSDGIGDQDSSSDGTTDNGNIGDSDQDEDDGNEATDSDSCAHSYGNWIIIKPATCKSEGKQSRTCEKCSETVEEIIPRNDAHTPVTDKGVAASCISVGLTDGSHCSLCNKVLVEQDIIPKSDNHRPVTDKAVAATCKDEGLTEGSHCGLCKKVLVEQTVVQRTENHTTVIDAAVPATCKDTGLTEGSHCGLCKKILVAQTVLPTTDDHNYISINIKATTTSQGYILHKCDICGKSYKDGYYDYAGTESLTYSVKSDGTCLVSGITDSEETNIDIPHKSPDGYTVTGIKAYAFRGNAKITSVTAPETVTVIEERAFDGCYKLLDAYIPGVVSIGANAFDSCNALKRVVYSDSLTSINEKTFYGCKALKECRAISSKNNLDTIITFGYYAFAMSGITNPTFSANLNSISLANKPFYYCKSLGRVDLSAATLSSLGGGFSNTSFKEFIFPKGLRTISGSCFASCYFGTMTLPDSVTCIDSYAFANAGFTKITTGSGLSKIEMQAFEYAMGEIDITKSERLESVGYRAFAGSEITSIILPPSVRSIGEEAFGECTQLKVLGIPFISTSPESSIYSTNCFGAIFKSGASNFDQDEYVPSSLKTVIITEDGAEIEYGDFTGLRLSILVLPESFTCDSSSLDFSLTSIYYKGSADDFPDISKAIVSKAPTVYYYSENMPGASGRYWHYVNGMPTAW